MAASQHIIGSWAGFGRSQTWEGLKDMLEELKHFVLESPEPALSHPNVYRNRTLNRNPRFVIKITLQWQYNILTESFLSV